MPLPSFNLDIQLADSQSKHGRQASTDSFYSDKENRCPTFQHQCHDQHRSNQTAYVGTSPKIDKDYLASLNKVPLNQLRPQILRLAKDQYGCRFLQKRIDETLVSKLLCVTNFGIIFQEIHLLLYELIIDPFGNYLIQKLVNYCSEEDLNLVLEILQHNLFLISINQHGTRALQKIIDRMNNSYQLSILTKRLKPYIIELIKDLNGNHVIQKILNKYTPGDCQFIYDSIIQDILVVATHKHGCCVLQKCLNHVNTNQMNAFSRKILQYNVFLRLINDQFGNYVLQYLVSINSIDVNYDLFNNFMNYGIGDLCNLKFSSNVVEKLLKSCFHNEVSAVEFQNLKFTIIYAILSSDSNKMINDPYGNYVIQTLIDILINPCVSYLIDTGTDQVILLPSLQQLLPPDFAQSFDSLQIQIIKAWFQNCKIVSSFGKRIQLKINIILNGVPKANHRKIHQRSQANSLIPYRTGRPNQNMNANGEFVQSETYPAPNHNILHRNSTLENRMPYEAPDVSYGLIANGSYWNHDPNDRAKGFGSDFVTSNLGYTHTNPMPNKMHPALRTKAAQDALMQRAYQQASGAGKFLTPSYSSNPVMESGMPFLGQMNQNELYRARALDTYMGGAAYNGGHYTAHFPDEGFLNSYKLSTRPQVHGDAFPTNQQTGQIFGDPRFVKSGVAMPGNGPIFRG